MTKLANAFSLNMLAAGFIGSVEVRPATLDEAREAAANSAIGHADTAAVVSSVLGVPVAFNRATLTLTHGDTVVVAQYKGPRLPEGAKELPAGATIEFNFVTIR